MLLLHELLLCFLTPLTFLQRASKASLQKLPVKRHGDKLSAGADSLHTGNQKAILKQTDFIMRPDMGIKPHEQEVDRMERLRPISAGQPSSLDSAELYGIDSLSSLRFRLALDKALQVAPNLSCQRRKLLLSARNQVFRLMHSFFRPQD